MALNPNQFGPARKPDKAVVTARRTALTENWQSSALKNVPDAELWAMRNDRSDQAEQELKSRNLL
jgi:hypothetical protein